MTRFIPTDIHFLFVVVALSVSMGKLIAQENTNATYLNWFDDKVGVENTALYEGIVYREAYRTINEKVKFYKSAQWYNGSVLYSGQPFYNVLLKYDVFGDQLILKQLDRLGGGSILLFKSNVSSFRIEDTQFVHLRQEEIGEAAGFYELLWENGSIRLFAKHQKNDFVRKDRRAAYYEFVDIKKLYLLDLSGKYYPINRKKELTDILPSLKKDIDSFYQKNKRLLNRDVDSFMISLIRNVSELYNPQSPNQNP